jgi:hypothetical protein
VLVIAFGSPYHGPRQPHSSASKERNRFRPARSLPGSSRQPFVSQPQKTSKPAKKVTILCSARSGIRLYKGKPSSGATIKTNTEVQYEEKQYQEKQYEETN